MNKVSVIVPIYNGSSTITETLTSLIPHKNLIHEIIVIDDGSTDNSIEIIKKIFKKHFLKTKKKIICHQKSLGLASTYNDGIKNSTGQLIVTLHQDIIIKKNSLLQLICPFNQENIVASYHRIIHPVRIWKKYNFWQKVLFDRKLNLIISGLDGKFDCYRKESLIKVGLFDSKHFFRAGEDGDIFYKLIKIGKVVPTKATIIHLHDINPNFGVKNIIYKQAQYANAHGAILRRYGIYTFDLFIRTFFREILLIGLIIPYIRILSLICIIVYSVLYNINTIKLYKNKPQVFILPFINIYLLFVSLVFSCKGFILGKQTV